MSVVTRKRQDSYAIVPNAVAEDERLSFEARGLLVYLLAKPNDWRVLVDDLMRAGSIGRDKAYKLISQLTAAGYIECHKRRDERGRILSIDYVVFDEPVQTSLPLPMPAQVRAPLPENQEQADPLPDLPDPAAPDPVNQDRLLKTHPDPLLKAPIPQAGTVSRLLAVWSARHHPENLEAVRRAFDALPSDTDREHAIEFAPEYCRLMTARRRPPYVMPYLKQRMWRDLVDAPEIDADGHFVITPNRPEWREWMGDIRRRFGQEAVDHTVRSGKIIRETRYPTQSRGVTAA